MTIVKVDVGTIGRLGGSRNSESQAEARKRNLINARANRWSPEARERARLRKVAKLTEQA